MPNAPLFALTSSTTDPLFDTFWSAYPKKAAKRDAQKAWKQAKVDAVLLTKMLAALTAQAAERHRRIVERRWVPEIPLPATWIRGERWNDEVPLRMTMASGAEELQQMKDDAQRRRDARAAK